jgi:hypothetical protein
MTLYFIPNGQIELMVAFGGIQAWPNTLQGCDTKDIAQDAQTGAFGSGTTGSFSLSGSGTITEQNLELLQNPWFLVVIAPISDTNPSLTMTVGPVLSASSSYQTLYMPEAYSIVTVTTTAAFLYTQQLSTGQSFSSDLMYVGLVFVPLLLIALFITLRQESKKVRKNGKGKKTTKTTKPKSRKST